MFLANKDEGFKNLYCNNIKSGNFLSFFKTEEDDDHMILCTEYNIEGHHTYCDNMDKRLHFHYSINGLQHITLKSTQQIISKLKTLKSATTNNDKVNPMPDVKPTPVPSSDIKQETTPQFDYNIPPKVNLKSNKPTNLLTMFKFKE
eukprot:5225075-Ditylum_brightwellii.AAC.1